MTGLGSELDDDSHDIRSQTVRLATTASFTGQKSLQTCIPNETNTITSHPSASHARHAMRVHACMPLFLCLKHCLLSADMLANLRTDFVPRMSKAGPRRGNVPRRAPLVNGSETG